MSCHQIWTLPNFDSAKYCFHQINQYLLFLMTMFENLDYYLTMLDAFKAWLEPT
jgi:hypothetical protein